MPFQAPQNMRNSLLQEIYVNAAVLNPTHPFAFTLENDNPNASIQTITFKRYISDVAKIAKSLQGAIPRRNPGEPVRTIGFFARSNYSYAVHLMACEFNRWIVSLFEELWPYPYLKSAS